MNVMGVQRNGFIANAVSPSVCDLALFTLFMSLVCNSKSKSKSKILYLFSGFITNLLLLLGIGLHFDMCVPIMLLAF